MAEATRQVFQNLTHWEIVVWYCLVAVSTAIFVVGVLLLVRKYRAGRGRFGRVDRPLRRLGRMTWIVLSHAWIKRRDGVAGLAHALMFYGFIVLAAGSAILAFDDDVSNRFF